MEEKIEYEPTFGFILKNLELTDSGTYECQVDLKRNFPATMQLRVSTRK
jgi:hypothetical protein